VRIYSVTGRPRGEDYCLAGEAIDAEERPAPRKPPCRARRGFWLLQIARHLRDRGPARRCDIQRAMGKVRATFTGATFGNVVYGHPWFAKEDRDGPYGRFFLTEEGRRGLQETEV
jgi:hypothetical protein